MSFIDNYRAQQAAGQQGWGDFISNTLPQIIARKTMLPDPSSKYPAAVNFGLAADRYLNPLRAPGTLYERLSQMGIDESIKKGFTDFIETSKMEAAGIKDIFLTPEEEVTRRQEAAAAAAKPAPPALGTRGPFPSVPPAPASTGPSNIFSMNVPGLPAPPTMTPFQMPPLPARAPLPMPPEMAMPDYGSFMEYMNAAKPSMETGGPSKWDSIGAGLAQGAANWDPRTGWGGLLGGALARGAMGSVAFKQTKKEEEKAYNEAMRRWNATMADIEAKRASEFANVKNKNAQNKWEYQTDAAQQDNIDALAQHKVNIENMAAVHEANKENAKLLYQYSLQKAELEQSQIAEANKDGVLWSEYDNGKRVFRYQKFDNKADDVDLKKIKDELGQDAYDMALFNKLTEPKNGKVDQLGLMKQIARTAVEGGYAPEVFGEDLYNEAIDFAQGQQLGNPGSKEYAEKIAEVVSNRLIRAVDITNKEQLDKLVLNGNNFARYLLGASNGSY